MNLFAFLIHSFKMHPFSTLFYIFRGYRKRALGTNGLSYPKSEKKCKYVSIDKYNVNFIAYVFILK